MERFPSEEKMMKLKRFEINYLNLYVQVIRFLLWNSCPFQNHASN